MSEFLKKNKSLVVVLGVSFCAALVLGWFNFTAIVKLNSAMDEIEEGGKIIKNISSTGNAAPKELDEEELDKMTHADREKTWKKWDAERKNPRIVKGNAEKIKQDAEKLQQKTWATQRTYGQIYDSAFNSFLKKLKQAPTLPPEAEKNLPETAKMEEVVTAEMAKFSLPVLHDSFVKIYEKAAAVKQKNASVKQKKFNGELFDAVFALIIAPPKKCSDADLYKQVAAKRFADAFLVFRDEVQKMTSEIVVPMDSIKEGKVVKDASGNPVRDTSPDDAAKSIFLQALGLQRTMDPIDFLDVYADPLRDRMLETAPKGELPDCLRHYYDLRLKRTIPLPAVSVIEPFAMLRSFLWDEPIKNNSTVLVTPPPQENIPHLTRRFQIYEHLFHTMSVAGIDSVKEIHQEGDLYGEFAEGSQKKYKNYTFKVTVRGNMKSIRELFNQLQMAYENENRVYNIVQIAMKRIQFGDKDNGSERKDVFAEAETAYLRTVAFQHEKKSAEDAKKLETEKSADGKKAEQPRGPGKPVREFQETRQKDYALPLIGADDTIEATFTFEYILYVGDAVPKETK